MIELRNTGCSNQHGANLFRHDGKAKGELNKTRRVACFYAGQACALWPPHHGMADWTGTAALTMTEPLSPTQAQILSTAAQPLAR